MRTRHRSLAIALTVALTTTFASATSFADAGRTVVMVETDPVTFALDGFATHIRLAFPGAERWTFGAGLYGMDFPALLVDLNPDNAGEGWSQRLTLGYGLFVDRYFGDGGAQGFFVGAQLAVQRYQIAKDDQGDERADYATILLMPRAGYLWKPIADSGFYLMPWVGVGGTAKIAGEAKLGDKEFDIAALIMFATLHVGWQF